MVRCRCLWILYNFSGVAFDGFIGFYRVCNGFVALGFFCEVSEGVIRF